MDTPRENDATDELPQPQGAVLAAACARALPIWAKQIDTARQQGQDAVVSLVKRFQDIDSRLDTALGAARSHAGADAIAHDTAQGQHLLAQVIEALRAIRSSRDALARQIRGLAAYADELRRMSGDVESLAFKTNTLALNAAIEAAHAGDVATGFAAVAREVRDLSAAARNTGKSISDKVGLISAALAQIVTTNECASARDAAVVTESEQHIHTVLECFRRRTQQLADLAERFVAENESIKGDLCEALVELQLQHRTSQILQQVVASIGQAQRHNHAGVADGDPGPQKAP